MGYWDYGSSQGSSSNSNSVTVFPSHLRNYFARQGRTGTLEVKWLGCISQVPCLDKTSRNVALSGKPSTIPPKRPCPGRKAWLGNATTTRSVRVRREGEPGRGDGQQQEIEMNNWRRERKASISFVAFVSLSAGLAMFVRPD